MYACMCLYHSSAACSSFFFALYIYLLQCTMYVGLQFEHFLHSFLLIENWMIWHCLSEICSEQLDLQFELLSSFQILKTLECNGNMLLPVSSVSHLIYECSEVELSSQNGKQRGSCWGGRKCYIMYYMCSVFT